MFLCLNNVIILLSISLPSAFLKRFPTRAYTHTHSTIHLFIVLLQRSGNYIRIRLILTWLNIVVNVWQMSIATIVIFVTLPHLLVKFAVNQFFLRGCMCDKTNRLVIVFPLFSVRIIFVRTDCDFSIRITHGIMINTWDLIRLGSFYDNDKHGKYFIELLPVFFVVVVVAHSNAIR